jgi:hypothetical protein
VTVTVYVVTELVAVGVPDIAPFVVENVSPAGSAGEIAYVSVPNPPDAVTGVNVGAKIFLVNVVVGTTCVVVNASSASTTSVKVAVAVNGTAPASLIVIVYSVEELGTVAVPVIAPSEEKVNPAGSAGKTVNVNTPVPPVAVTGVNDVVAMFCCNVLVGITVFAIKGMDSTDSENVSDLD